MSSRKQKLEASLEGLFSVNKAHSSQGKGYSLSGEKEQNNEEQNQTKETTSVAPFIVMNDERKASKQAPSSIGVVHPTPEEVKLQVPSVQKKELPTQTSSSSLTNQNAPITVGERKVITPAASQTSMRPIEMSANELVSKETDEIFQIVTFRVNNNFYGINIDAVQTIIKPQNACPVPFTTDYVIGLINLRGQIFPIIDLRKRLGIPALEETKETRIVIVSIRNEWAGIMVDAVTGVTNLPSGAIETTSNYVLDSDTNLLMGIGKSELHLILILDVFALFAMGEKSGFKIIHHDQINDYNA